MSLNEIHLTPHQVVSLYRDTLVEMRSPAVATKVQPKKEKTGAPAFLGKNEKHILILSSDTTVPFVGDKSLSFLTNVLSACKMSLGDVAIVNWANLQDKSYTELLAELESRIVLLFNLDPISFGLPINFPHFQVQEFAGHTYVHAPALSEIEASKDLKTKLWTTLKRVFNV